MLFSCDTFVALPPATKDNCVIFAKNSDRPQDEVQEVVYSPSKEYPANSHVQCTYIAIPQVPRTAACVLSKPAWMWGAEMGANDFGVCIGNEAIWTKVLKDERNEERLLGMDLVRLGLERGRSAKEAMDAITSLLKEHGQGGPCYDDPRLSDFTYHNSFIIADSTEAWVLETAGREWAAEKVTSGLKNISNILTIGTKIDAKSDGLLSLAESKSFWSKADGDLDFGKAYAAELPIKVEGSEHPEHRYRCGKELMEKLSSDGKLNASLMFGILRDKPSGICRTGTASDPSNPLPAVASTGSQVSILYPSGGSSKPNVHWFTATPNPALSVFKPFIFTPNVLDTALTRAPQFPEMFDPAKVKPRFQKVVDRRHPLYRGHEETMRPLVGGDVNGDAMDLLETLRKLETQCVMDLETFLEGFDGSRIGELDELFKDAVESEMKFYKVGRKRERWAGKEGGVWKGWREREEEEGKRETEKGRRDG